MMALARSSCSRATASSPRVASSACWRPRSSPSTTGADAGTGWSSAEARRAQPPKLLTTRAPSRIRPPCSISFWVFVFIALSCFFRAAMTLAPRVKSSSIPFNRLIGDVAAPVPVRAARLLQQPYPLDLHPAVRCLHHVVDREQRDRHGREHLHLHPGSADCLGRAAYPHARQRLVERRFHLDVVEAEGVTQGDELGRPLGRYRARHFAHGQHVPLRDRLIGHEAVRLARHPDRSLRHGGADRDRLVPHVHHPRPARLVHVRQLHACSPAARSSASTAASSWGFTFPWANSRASNTRAIASTTFAACFPRPPRACSRNCSSNPSSRSLNPPRAWNGCCFRALA